MQAQLSPLSLRTKSVPSDESTLAVVPRGAWLREAHVKKQSSMPPAGSRCSFCGCDSKYQLVCDDCMHEMLEQMEAFSSGKDLKPMSGTTATFRFTNVFL